MGSCIHAIESVILDVLNRYIVRIWSKKQSLKIWKLYILARQKVPLKLEPKSVPDKKIITIERSQVFVSGKLKRCFNGCLGLCQTPLIIDSRLYMSKPFKWLCFEMRSPCTLLTQGWLGNSGVYYSRHSEATVPMIQETQPAGWAGSQLWHHSFSVNSICRQNSSVAESRRIPPRLQRKAWSPVVFPMNVMHEPGEVKPKVQWRCHKVRGARKMEYLLRQIMWTEQSLSNREHLCAAVSKTIRRGLPEIL